MQKLLLLFLSFSLLFVVSDISHAKSKNPLLKVFHIKGSAFVYRNNKDAKPLKKNDRIFKDDVLRTDKKSILILAMKDGSKIKLNPESIIQVEKIFQKGENKKKDSSLILEIGSLFINYVNKDKKNNSMHVRTKNIAMGVRGTEFFAHKQEIDSDQVSMTVKEGNVKVRCKSTKEQVEVTDGKGTIVDRRGRLLKPTKFEWSNKLNWNQNPNMGSLETSEKVFAKIRQRYNHYCHMVAKKRDALYKKNKNKFEQLKKKNKRFFGN